MEQEIEIMHFAAYYFTDVHIGEYFQLVQGFQGCSGIKGKTGHFLLSLGTITGIGGSWQLNSKKFRGSLLLLREQGARSLCATATGSYDVHIDSYVTNSTALLCKRENKARDLVFDRDRIIIMTFRLTYTLHILCKTALLGKRENKARDLMGDRDRTISPEQLRRYEDAPGQRTERQTGLGDVSIDKKRPMIGR
ncbi:hypothetical protein J6590_079303 [Homalodisca vitripennis]|nr:hypothetical protein J6590_079303 [Homalodisca vitripennis]